MNRLDSPRQSFPEPFTTQTVSPIRLNALAMQWETRTTLASPRLPFPLAAVDTEGWRGIYRTKVEWGSSSQGS